MYLGEYMDQIEELIKECSIEDKLAITSGIYNTFTRKYAKEYIEWTDKFYSYPHGREHPHYAIIVARRKEAFEELQK